MRCSVSSSLPFVNNISDVYQLNDLKCLLLRVHQLFSHPDNNRNEAESALIRSYTDRLRSHLQELEDTTSKLLQTHSDSGTQGFSYYRWLRVGGRITTIRSNIVETRSNLNLAISAHMYVLDMFLFTCSPELLQGFTKWAIESRPTPCPGTGVHSTIEFQ